MVPGKRNKWPKVPLPDPAMDALTAYQVPRGRDADPLVSNPELPLVGRLDGQGGLWAALIYDVLCDGSERRAAAVKATDERAAERIRQGSTHWLRHTYGAHIIARGIAQDVMQTALGHECQTTTSICVRSEKARKHRELQAVFAKKLSRWGRQPEQGGGSTQFCPGAPGRRCGNQVSTPAGEVRP